MIRSERLSNKTVSSVKKRPVTPITYEVCAEILGKKQLPAQVRNDLIERLTSLSTDQFVPIFSQHTTFTNSFLYLFLRLDRGINEWSFTLGDRRKRELMTYVSALSSTQILNILFGEALADEQHRILNEILLLISEHPFDTNTSDFIPLLNAISTLDKAIISSFFKTKKHGLLNSYEKGANLFVSKASDNDVALSLLHLIEKLDPYEIYAIFLGKNEFGFNSDNLLIRIARRHSCEAMTKAVHIIFKLNKKYYDEIIRQKIDFCSTSQSIRRHTVSMPDPVYAISEAFKHKNPSIALILVQALNQCVPAQEWLTKHTWGFESPIFYALQYQNTEVMAYVLEQPHLSLHDEISRCKTKLNNNIRYLSLCKSILDLIDASPLRRAIHDNPLKQFPSDLKALVSSNPATIASRWSEQNTLLHLAAAKNHLEALLFLLSQPMDIDAVNAQGFTAFHLSLSHGREECVKAFLEHGKVSLHIAGTDGIWPLQHIMRYNQYALAKTGLRLLLKALPHEAVFSSLVQALNTISAPTLRGSKTDELRQAMNKTYPNLSIADTLSVCCETANHATGALLQEVAALHKTAGNTQLNQAAEAFLIQQLQVILESHHPEHQYAARMALILFLFSQSTPYILAVLKQLSIGARQRLELEEVLIQALTKPIIYSKLSYNDHKTLLTFFEIPSESFLRLISRQLEQSDLTLLPTALLRDFSKYSTFTFLHNTSHRRIHPALMILALEKGMESRLLDLATQEGLEKALEKELVLLSSQTPDESTRSLSCILNLITHSNVKAFVQARLIKTDLEAIPATLFANFTQDTLLDEHSLLWDMFWSFAENPKQVFELNDDKALVSFVGQLSVDDAALLTKNYITLLQDPDTSFRQKLHQCVMNGLFNSSQLASILPLLFQWSIAYSPNTTLKDELIEQMPYLLETLPGSAWNGIDEMLLNTGNDYIASLKLLKEGLLTKDNGSVSRLLNIWPLLNEDFPLRHDASVLFVTSLLPIIKDNLLSLDSRVAIETVVRLLSCKLSTGPSKVINDLPEELVILMLEHALTGIANNDYARGIICKKLLTCLSYACAEDNKTHLSLIKKRLGQQDLSILQDTQLIKIANSILSTQDANLEDATYDGVWIQRLITSIDFVASSTPDTLNQLIERYRLLSLSLKQDELDNLNRWISGRLLHADHYSDALKRVRLEMIQDPTRHHHLLAKRQRLLEFRVDDSIRALFNQLEDTCLQLKGTKPAQAEKALTTLCSYYNQRLNGLRTDRLFKLSNIVFARVRRGDVHLAQSTLMQWLARYLPHLNFEQSELERKKNIYLYDSTGKKIGFIDELNQAQAFVNDEPCPLIEVPGITTDTVLYDENRRRLGLLTQTSDVQYENLFQKSTSALMVAKVPQDSLLQSPQALDLLLQDVLHHGEIDTLYQCPEISEELEKRRWVTSQLDAQFARKSKAVNLNGIDSFVAVHSSESVLELLQHTKNALNAAALFESILKQDDKRAALFEQGPSSFAVFLYRFKPVSIFTDFLIQHHKAPWFHQGLQLFLQATPLPTKRAALLLEAMPLVGEHRESIVHALIATETNARLLLNDFLSDDASISIQNARTTTIDAITACLSIEHITSILPALYKAHHLLTCAQYRLVFMAIDAHVDSLFPARELRLLERGAWHTNDLIELTRMAKRHWNEGKSIDTDRAIGKRLFAELAFRTANFGQTNLFYTETGRFDVPMAQFNLSRSVLSTLLALTISPSFMERIKSAFGALDVAHWFDKQHANERELSNFLETQGALIDWRKMANQSWELSDGTKLPLISAFLLNYSGRTELVEKLIEDYFDSSASINSKTNPHHVTQLLSAFPDRDISRLIFNILKARVIETPALLDITTLNHMAVFYTSHELKLKADTELTARHLALIKFFGQQKQYDVVLMLCRLIPNSNSHTKFLKQIKTEARVERELAPFMNKWYFPILTFFKRGWNYWGKTPSNYIKFCDDQAPNAALRETPKTVRTNVLGGDEADNQIEHHRIITRAKDLKVRLNNVSPQSVTTPIVTCNPDTTPKLSVHGLFAHADEGVLNPMHESFVPIEIAKC